MPDKRNDELFIERVFTFSLKYEDATTVEVWASPHFGDSETASRFASLVGAVLGKLPAPLREKLYHVIIHSGDETAYAEEEGRFFVFYSGNIEKRISPHDLEETVFHETIHAILEADHAKDPVWMPAQKYAEEFPQKVDLSESALFACAMFRTPGRLPAEVERAVRKIMPHRLEYLRKLFRPLEEEFQP